MKAAIFSLSRSPQLKQLWHDYGTYIIIGSIILIILAIVGSITEYLERRKLEAQEQEVDIGQRHSRIGIASFTISIVSGFLILFLLYLIGILTQSTPSGLSEESPAGIALVLFIIFLFFADVVALVLGISGLLQKDRKKIFSVLGTWFSLLTIILLTLKIFEE